MAAKVSHHPNEDLLKYTHRHFSTAPYILWWGRVGAEHFFMALLSLPWTAQRCPRQHCADKHRWVCGEAERKGSSGQLGCGLNSALHSCCDPGSSFLQPAVPAHLIQQQQQEIPCREMFSDHLFTFLKKVFFLSSSFLPEHVWLCSSCWPGYPSRPWHLLVSFANAVKLRAVINNAWPKHSLAEIHK